MILEITIPRLKIMVGHWVGSLRRGTYTRFGHREDGKQPAYMLGREQWPRYKR